MNSSFARTRIAIGLLLTCLCNGNSSACGRIANMNSPSPITLHQKTEENSTLATELLLPEQDEDPCLRRNTFHARADCLLPLLETYYGRNFTVYCPGFSIVLAKSGCRGCPWSRINPDTLPNIGNRRFPLKPTHLYFRNVTPACSIAHHVEEYKTRNIVFNVLGIYALVATASLAMISYLGATSVDEDGKLKPVSSSESEVSEFMYLGNLWLVYYCLNLVLASVDDFYRYCEALSSHFTQYLIKIAAYSTTLLISLSRCYLLRVPFPTPNLRGYWWRVRAHYLVTILTIAGVPAALIIDMPSVPSRFDLWCFAGQEDKTMGIIQYSKLLLEFLAVMVFTFRTKSRPWAKRLRYSCLAVIMVLSWIVAGVCIFTDLYKPRGHSMFITGILDQDIAGRAMQLVHINFISFLGLSEILSPELEHNQTADIESSTS